MHLTDSNMKSKCITDSDGTKRWKLNGKYHRIDGPAIEWSNGDKSWYLYNKLHRLDGPAIERAYGYKAWYLNNKRHREDGPAMEFGNGTKEWWINDKKLTFKQWLSAIWDTLSKEEQKYYAFNGFEYEE